VIGSAASGPAAPQVHHTESDASFGSALLTGLDAPLPDPLAVGGGTVLTLSGWCQSTGAPIRSFVLLCNNQPQHVEFFNVLIELAQTRPREPVADRRRRGSFLGQVTIPASWAPGVAQFAVRATLADGTRRHAPLGTAQLVQGLAAEPVTAPAAAGAGPLVAVCMATYNPPWTLFRSQVRSLQEQTHRNWVCLVNDDGSGEELYGRIRTLLAADPRFVVRRNDRNVGFFHNFEQCLAAVPASAAFVALADQDDVWNPDKLASLLAAFDADTQLVYSDMRVVRPDGRVLADSFWKSRRNNWTNFPSLLMANTVTGAASMFRRSLLADALPFPPRFGHMYHDHWLAALALARGRIGYVARPLYDYVQHGGNVIGHVHASGAGWPKMLAAVARRCFTPRRARQYGRDLLATGRHFYFTELVHVQQMARVMELRCGDRLDPEKRRAVRRMARLTQSPAAWGWLAERWLRHAGRPTETLFREYELLLGLCWRAAAQLGGTLRKPDTKPQQLADETGHQRAYCKSMRTFVC
jgi:glycosyltransferase involved in cell wall biosynthesis